MIGREDGYTILEALCAFAILSVALVALYGLGGTSYRILSDGTDADRVALLAQSKLDQLATVHTELPGFQMGEFEGTGVKWQLAANDVAETDKDKNEFHLQEMRLTLVWNTLRGENRFVVAGRHLWAGRP
jgi:Tfp pilus assembly protein PilV